MPHSAISASASWILHPSASREPVALKKPNPWGLFDMLGNRREWCSDPYASYPSEAVTDPLVEADVPMSNSSTCRVVRGGSYGTPASQCRSAWRFRSDTRTLYHEGFGTRLAVSLEALPAMGPLGESSTANSSR
ncbi:MAG: SUMF1/EgtB/PvdO family nonheme iron enzyme [Pirellulaceae bacterium]|nr:SUMF1/EgtB/PvdO family nonheme iron enzyme [Pirellulaceae bacterium]